MGSQPIAISPDYMHSMHVQLQFPEAFIAITIDVAIRSKVAKASACYIRDLE